VLIGSHIRRLSSWGMLMNQNSTGLAATNSVLDGSEPKMRASAPVESSSAPSSYEQFSTAALEHQEALHRRAFALTRAPADAADLVQRTFERALQSLNLFEPGTNMRCWLLRIMLNLFLDDCRRRASRPTELLDGDVPAAPEANPDDEPLWTRVTLEQVRLTIHELRDPYREVYELRVTGKLSYQEISDRLNIPLGTVATRLARGREELCSLLTKHLEREARR
jgi:RNA polymerase sigma-70 factor, ECF subfamily